MQAGARRFVMAPNSAPHARAAVTRLSFTRLLHRLCEFFFTSRNRQFGTLTLRHAVPTINEYREFASAGGLISYGGSLTDSYRNAGIYAGRILKGEKPANLPAQQSTRAGLT